MGVNVAHTKTSSLSYISLLWTLDQVWSSLAALEMFPLDYSRLQREKSRGATPMHAKWIKLDQREPSVTWLAAPVFEHFRNL